MRVDLLLAGDVPWYDMNDLEPHEVERTRFLVAALTEAGHPPHVVVGPVIYPEDCDCAFLAAFDRAEELWTAVSHRRPDGGR